MKVWRSGGSPATVGGIGAGTTGGGSIRSGSFRGGRFRPSKIRDRGRRRGRLTPLATSLVFITVLFCAGRAAAQNGPDESSVAAMAQGLAVTPEQLQQYKNQYPALPASQEDELCTRVAAKHMSPEDIQSLAGSLGLSADEVAKLQQCAQIGQAPNGAGREQSGRIGDRNGVAAINREIGNGFNLQQPSAIEQRFRDLGRPQQEPSNPSPEKLEQFGYSAFAARVSTFAPTDNVPVSDDYVLGPGDSLTILMWGRLNEKLDLPVQRDGTILMPHIGPIAVAGLSFADAKKMVEARASQIEGVQISVTMGAIRTMQVFVLGQVNQPGLYTVSALAHISNALNAAGGVSKVGSLRNVEIRRDNRTVRVVDLYSMLLHGNAAGDIGLEPRDVIFVPVIGAVVGVAGDVKAPAIYELRGPEDLREVLRIAGGISAFGYAQRIQVERIADHQRRIALDIDMNELGRTRAPIRDGDLIKVFAVLPRQQNVVVLKGNVNRPGSYQWFDGMRVSDLVREGEGLGDHAFMEYASIRRRIGAAQEVQYVPVDLEGALEEYTSGVDLTLLPRDELTVFSDTDLRDLPTVTVSGAVRKPGTYPLTAGMKVSDLIFEAGGPEPQAYLQQGVLARNHVVNGATATHVYEDVDLRAALKPDSIDDPPLRRDDQLFVQEATNWHKTWSVKLRGEVARPGPYAVRDGETLAELLNDAGGLRADAYPQAIVFIRRSVRQEEQQRLEQSRIRLQQDIARVALMPHQAGQAQNDQSQALATMERVLSQTQGQQAVGRIALNVTTISTLAESPSNIALENDDVITVPRRPGSINVLGEVYNPVAIVYEPRLRVRDYLQRAGGPTDGADQDHIFVIKANGSIMTDKSYRDMQRNQTFPLLPLVSNGLMDAYLEPGDTVFVPEKLVMISGLQYATDVSQIIANAALSLGVIGILGSSI